MLAHTKKKVPVMTGNKLKLKIGNELRHGTEVKNDCHVQMIFARAGFPPSSELVFMPQSCQVFYL